MNKKKLPSIGTICMLLFSLNCLMLFGQSERKNTMLKELDSLQKVYIESKEISQKVRVLNKIILKIPSTKDSAYSYYLNELKVISEKTNNIDGLFYYKKAVLNKLLDERKTEEAIVKAKELLDSDLVKGIPQRNSFNFHGNKFIAECYYSLRQPDSVVKYTTKALQSTNNDTLRYRAYDMLANIFTIKREYNIALKQLDSSMVLAGRLNIPRYTEDVHYRLGKVQRKMSFYEESEKNLLIALDLCEKRKIRSDRDIASTLQELGRLYRQMRRYADAADYLNESLQLYKKIGRTRTVANLHNDLSSLYIKIKDFKKGLFHAKKSLIIYDKLGRGSDKAVSYSRLGRLYYSITPKKFDSSFFYLDKAQDLYKKENDMEGEMFTELYLFNLYQLQKKTRKATEHINRHLFLQDSLNKTKNRALLAKLEVEMETVKKEKQIVVEREKTQKEELKNARLTLYLMLSLILVVILPLILYFYFKAKRKEQEAVLQKQSRNIGILEGKISTLLNTSEAITSKLSITFDEYIKKEYDITEKMFEFWKLWALGYQEKEMAKELGIKLSSVGSRRDSLYSKLFQKTRIKNMDKNKSVGIYHKEITAFYNRLITEVNEISTQN